MWSRLQEFAAEGGGHVGRLPTSKVCGNIADFAISFSCMIHNASCYAPGTADAVNVQRRLEACQYLKRRALEAVKCIDIRSKLDEPLCDFVAPLTGC